MAGKENKVKHAINDEFAGISEDETNHPGIPVTADEFERGVDIILEAQQEFLRAVNPFESVKIKSFGAARR